MNVIRYLRILPRNWMPSAYPTKDEIRHWINNKQVIINGKYPSPSDEVIFPVHELILFQTMERVEGLRGETIRKQ